VLDRTGGFGADYTFEATGNVGVRRQAVESARMGWGLATVCGVAGTGETLDVVPRFLITGRRVAGSSFCGGQGAAPRGQGPDAGRRPALPDYGAPRRRLVLRRRQGPRPGAEARRPLPRRRHRR